MEAGLRELPVGDFAGRNSAEAWAEQCALEDETCEELVEDHSVRHARSMTEDGSAGKGRIIRHCCGPHFHRIEGFPVTVRSDTASPGYAHFAPTRATPKR